MSKNHVINKKFNKDSFSHFSYLKNSVVEKLVERIYILKNDQA